MKKLIDKHEAYSKLKHEAETHDLSFYAEAYERAARIIDQMPCVDAEPVRHGHYIEIGAHRDEDGYILRDYECSNCFGIHVDIPDDEHDLAPYCCMCGAKMDGGADK